MNIIRKYKWRIVNQIRKMKTRLLQEVKPDDAGILFIVFKNNKMLNETIVSILSIRKHNTSVPVCVMTDRDDFIRKQVERLKIKNIQIVKVAPQHFRAKVDFICKTPFDKTLYADSDTIFKFDPVKMLDALDCFDVLFCHDFSRKRAYYAGRIKAYDQVPDILPELNGGIFAFRKSQSVIEFLESWRKIFYQYFDLTHGYDQPSLRIAVSSANKVRFFVLNEEYNCRPKSILQKCLNDTNENYYDSISPKVIHRHFDVEVSEYDVEQLWDYIERVETADILRPYGFEKI